MIFLSLVARLVLSDRIELLKYNLYLPLALLAPNLIFLLLLSPLQWLWRGAGIIASFTLLLIGFWIEQPNLFRSPPSPAAGGFTVMGYNVKSYSWGSDRVIATILEHDPDILCLQEGTFGGWAPPKVKAALGSEYNWAVGDLLSVASRFPIRESRMLVSRGQIRVMRAIVETPKGAVTILSVDLAPPQRRIDSDAFDEFWALMEMQEGPVIVVGDMNVPRGSHQLGRATRGLTDSFRSTGTPRYLATWPSHFPLWQIDHMFHREGVEVLNSWIGTSLASDHLPILAEYQLR